MKIIDINGFVGYIKKRIQPGMSVEELLRRMDQSGVDETVAWNTISSRQIFGGNEEMTQIAKESNGRIHACYMVHPRLDGFQMPKAPEFMEYLKANRPAAVTIRPTTHGYPLTAQYCGELMEVLQELRLPVILASSKEFGDFKRDIPVLAKQFPKLPMVVHTDGYTHCMFNYICMKDTENIILGVGKMCSLGELDNLVQVYGSHRFVLSSTAGCQASGGLGMIYMGRFSQEDKENILGGTWQKLQEGVKWA